MRRRSIKQSCIYLANAVHVVVRRGKNFRRGGVPTKLLIGKKGALTFSAAPHSGGECPLSWPWLRGEYVHVSYLKFRFKRFLARAPSARTEAAAAAGQRNY